MNKQEFLGELREKLSGLPESDIEERVVFYSEMIDDRIEDGIPEETAVGEMGSVDGVAQQIIADTPLTKLVKERIAPKKKIKAWEIVLLVLGSPVWLPILLVILAVMLLFYVLIWSMIAVLWSMFAAFAACGVAGVAAGIYFATLGHGLTGLAVIGCAIICAGLSIFTFIGSKEITAGFLIITKNAVIRIKNRIVKKEGV